MPASEFYESDPRARELRDVCISMLLAAQAQIDGDDRWSELLEGNRRLAKMGIEPNMHAFRPDDLEADAKRARLMSDPVIKVEWIAGQIRIMLQRSEVLVKPLHEAELKEHGEELLEEAGVYTVPPSASHRVVDFQGSQQLIATLQLMLGV